MANNAEKVRQGKRHLRYFFPFALPQEATNYINSLPDIADQPVEYRGRFNIPVIVNPSISFEEQAKMLRIDLPENLTELGIRSWPDPRRIETPNEPYLIWVQDHLRFSQSATQARETAAPDEVMVAPIELVSYLLASVDHHEVLDFHDLGAPGSEVGNEGWFLVAGHLMGSTFDWEFNDNKLLNGVQLTRGIQVSTRK